MIIRKIKKEDIEKDDSEIWLTFIDIMADEDYANLNEIQRRPHLCFIYEAELDFGGHLQYFKKYEDTYLEETIEALEFIGAKKQLNVLKKAKETYYLKKKKGMVKFLPYADPSKYNEYSQYDQEFYEAEPILQELLEVYLETYMDQFIEIV